jgi:hypothetical protein
MHMMKDVDTLSRYFKDPLIQEYESFVLQAHQCDAEQRPAVYCSPSLFPECALCCPDHVSSLSACCCLFPLPIPGMRSLLP